MTTQTEKAARTRKEPAGPSYEEVHAAHQCHTLAQLLYSQIVANHPWLVQAPPPWAVPMAGLQGAQPPWPQAGKPTPWGL